MTVLKDVLKGDCDFKMDVLKVCKIGLRKRTISQSSVANIHVYTCVPCRYGSAQQWVYITNYLLNPKGEQTSNINMQYQNTMKQTEWKYSPLLITDTGAGIADIEQVRERGGLWEEKSLWGEDRERQRGTVTTWNDNVKEDISRVLQ